MIMPAVATEASDQQPSSVPPTAQEAHEALDVLRRLAAHAPADAAALGLSLPAGNGHVALNRSYPSEFIADSDYKATLPDLQNGPESLIKGSHAPIQHVGISNFRLPLDYRKRDGGLINLETSVTGSVSLDAAKKGINMSRIMRTFYGHAGEAFDHARIEAVLESYLEDIESAAARLQLSFRYPMMRPSLRSGLEGYQYYDVSFESVRNGIKSMRMLHLDYVYSSTCPCSLELSEHARVSRRQIATPHSQRSVARLSVVVEGDRPLWIEDLVGLCNAAIPTETQVMVKREDEQAFAELNASNPIFVEDAVRLLCEALKGEDRIGDFRVVASHQESLHSHDAMSILTQGETFAQASHDPRLFSTLIHTS
ncbi:MAG: GTP cyclohydrolase FolE2 [Alphaproteobacteria bacterium]|nr:GTP cyclohydrolase FolE2 [Alphaproteobacteria bacterium]